MIAARRLMPQPAQIKKNVATVQRLDAPIKGLSLIGKTSVGDPQTATILSNWIVREDRIAVRPGYKLVRDLFPSGTRFAAAQLMPFLATPQHLLAATNHTVVRATDGVLVKGGFQSDDWHWTMFANLGQKKYLVMVNGKDGVWSYDGDTTPALVNITSLSAATEAVCTVGVGDIGKFSDGMIVTISGATGGMTVANGAHSIKSVGTPTNTFTLVGVNTSGGGTAQTTAKVQPPGGMFKEEVRAGTDAPYCQPDQFQIVLAHINRLYFADSSTLAVYYLPLQSKGGPFNADTTKDPGLLKVLPLNAIMRRGGYIRALASWSIDGGSGMDDKLVVFSSNGEAAVFTGIDPADQGFGLIGVYRFDAPMSRYCCANYGGDLWVLTSTALAPLSTLMRAETEKVNKAEKGVVTYFRALSSKYAALPGWYVTLDSTTGRILCNMPGGAPNRYQQMIRFMPDPVWAQWNSIPARSWSWMGDRLYCGSDEGKVYEVAESILSDDGLPITAEVRGAWQNYKTPNLKHFKLLRVYAQSSGLAIKPFIDVAVNYLDRAPINQPETINAAPGTPWGTPWGSPWSPGKKPQLQWGGVARSGTVGAPHVAVSVLEARYEISGFDIVYEGGSIL